MKAILRRDGTKALLILKGEFDAFIRDAFLEQVERLTSQGARRLVLDLARVRFLSSAGVTALLRARGHLDGLEGRLVLARPSRAVRRTLEILDMEGCFEWAPEDDTTVRAGGASRQVA